MELKSTPRLPQIRNLPPLRVAVLPEVQPLPLPGTLPYPRKQESDQNNAFFNYNDPDQINSFADVLYKNLGKLRIDGEWRLDQLLSMSVKSLQEGAMLTYEGVLAPMAAGNYEAAVLNGLINLGETMDIAANVVKGLAIDGKEGLYKSTFGRTNYDADTGHLATDLAAEFVADPFNWISLGGSSLMKGAVRKTVKEMTEEGVSQVNRKIVRAIAQNYKGNFAEAVDTVWKNTTLLKDISPEAIHRLKNLSVDKYTVSLMNTVSSTMRVSDLIERGLFNTSTALMPVVIQSMAVPGVKHLLNKFRSILVQGYTDERLAVNTFNMIAKRPELEAQLRDWQRMLPESAHFTPNTIERLVQDSVRNDATALSEVLLKSRSKELDILSFKQSLDEFAQMRTGNPKLKFNEWYQTISQAYQMSSMHMAIEPLYQSARRVQQQYKSAVQYTSSLAKYKNADRILTDYAELGKSPIQLLGVTPGARHEIQLQLKQIEMRFMDLRRFEAQAHLDDLPWIEKHYEFRTALLEHPLYDDFADAYWKMVDAVEAAIAVNDDSLVRLATQEYNDDLRRIFSVNAQHLHPYVQDLLAKGTARSADTLKQIEALRTLKDDLAQYVEGFSQKSWEDTLKQMATRNNKLFDVMRETELIKTRVHNNIVDIFDGEYDHGAALRLLEDANIISLMDELIELNSTHTQFHMPELEALLRRVTPHPDSVTYTTRVVKGRSKLPDEPLLLWHDLKVSDPTITQAELERHANVLTRTDQPFAKHDIPDRVVKTAQAKEGAELVLDIESLGDFYDYVEDLHRTASSMERAIEDAYQNPHTVAETKTLLIPVQRLKDAAEALLDRMIEPSYVPFALDYQEYSFKVSQQAAYNILLSNPNLRQLIQNIYERRELGNALHVMANAGHAQAIKIINRIEGIASGLELFRSIESLPADAEFKQGFIDTLHGFAKRPFNQVLNRQESYKHVVVNKLADKLANVKNAKRYSLEAYMYTMPEEARQYVKQFGSSLHNATVDVKINKHLLDSLPEYVTKSGLPATSFVMDIETTGFNEFMGDVLQVAVEFPDGTLHNYMARATVYPKDSVMRTLLDDPDGLLSPEELQAGFRERFMDLTPDLLAKHYPNSTHHVFETQKEMLERIFNDMALVTPSGNTPVIHGHNFERFDRSFLQTTMRREQAHVNLNRYEIDDTLVRQRAAEGIRTLTEAERQMVYDTIDRYMDLRMSEPVYLGKLERVTTQDSRTRLWGLGHSSEFIESMNSGLIDALSQVRDELTEQGLDPILGELLSNGIGGAWEGLSTLADVNSSLNKLYMDKADISEVFERLRQVDPNLTYKLRSGEEVAAYPPDVRQLLETLQRVDRFADLPPEARNDSNITQLLMLDQILEGRISQGQYIAARTEVDGKLVMDHLRVDPSEPLNYNERKQLYKTAAKIESMGSSIKQRELLEDALPHYGKVQRLILEELHKRALIPASVSFVAERFRPDVPVEYLHAQTEFLYNKLKLLMMDQGFPAPDYSQYGEAFAFLGDLEKLQRAPKWQEEMTVARYFNPMRAAGELPENYAFNERFFNAAEDKTMHRLEDMLNLQYAEGVGAPRAKVMASFLRPFHDTFAKTRRLIEDAEFLTRSGTKTTYRTALSGDQAAFIKELRKPYEAIDSAVAKQAMLRLFNLSPEDLVKEMAHQRFGFVTFHQDDLLGMLEDYKEFISRLPKEVELNIVDSRIYLTLAKDVDISQLEYKPIKGVFNIPKPSLSSSQIQFREVLDEVIGNYTKIAELSPGAQLSTLEFMDVEHFVNIMDRIPKEVRDRMIPLETLLKHYRFEGQPFNHSVLGTIHSRRQLMPYTSYNPMKIQLAAVERVHERVDAQMQYAHMFFDQTHSIGTLIDQGIDPAGVVDSIKNAKGGIRLAYLSNHEKKGFVVKSVHVLSVKDLEFAREVNAVPMTLDMYNKAKSVLNDDRIDSAVLNFLNRNAIYPFKVGVLVTAGFLMRNGVDSLMMKNMFTANSTSIFRSTAEALQLSNQYHTVWNELRRIMKEAPERMPISKATDHYFSSGTPRMKRELFDFVYKLDMEGALNGVSKEIQSYYGDAFDALYRRARHGHLYKVDDVKQFIQGSESMMNAEYATRFKDNPEVLAELQRLRKEFKFYKQASAMRQKTYNKALDLETLVVYLKRPELIPVEVQEEVHRLMEATKNVDTKEYMMHRLMNNPIMNGVFDITNKTEEVARLSQYLFQVKELGAPEFKAIAEVYRTHFDYTHRSTAQQYFEMLFPFSTFATNNFMYWIETLNQGGMNAGRIRDIIMPIADLDDYDEWDIQNRRTVRYQIMSGNIVLDHESGLTLKLNPSVMDALQILYAPKSAVEQRIFSPLRTMYEYAKAERYEWETEEQFETRKENMLISTVPVFGAAYLRARSARKLQNQFHNPVVSALPSVFNKTSVPGQKLQRRMWPQYQYYGGNWYNFNYKGTRAWRPYVKYPASMAAFNQVRWSGYNTGARLTHAYRSVTKWKRQGWNTFTKHNRSRLALLLLPTNKYTVRMKNTLLRTR